MKRLMLTLEFPPQKGGIATYVYNLAKHVPPDEIVVCTPPTNEVLVDKKFDSENDLKTFRKKSYWLLVWPHWLRWLLAVWKIVKTEKIDVIHIHHVLPSGYIAVFFKKIFKVPYVVFLHGTDLRLALKNKQKVKKVSYILNNASKVVVNSAYLQNELKGNFKLTVPVEIIFPCPSDNFLSDVNYEKISKLRVNFGLEGKKVMISVGRLVKSKGHHQLLEYIPELLKSVPNLVWLVVGNGEESKSLVENVQKNNLQSVVRFLGEVSLDDLPDYYALANIFVLLTRPTERSVESFGTVFLEASAVGIPVVAGKCGGVEEAVQEGVTGYLVDSNSQNEVVTSIVKILTNPNLAVEMGRKGKEFVLAKFTWKKQIEKTNL
jgi:phosphatidylinositol alpha-1,6-mannosyltransferase